MPFGYQEFDLPQRGFSTLLLAVTHPCRQSNACACACCYSVWCLLSQACAILQSSTSYSGKSWRSADCVEVGQQGPGFSLVAAAPALEDVQASVTQLAEAASTTVAGGLGSLQEASTGLMSQFRGFVSLDQVRTCAVPAYPANADASMCWPGCAKTSTAHIGVHAAY